MEQALVRTMAAEPEVTAEQIAERIGCSLAQVKRSTFYRRVAIARLGRERNLTDDLVHSLLD